MSLNRITAPPVLPVSEVEAWDHLRVHMGQYGVEPVDRARILRIIESAVSELDGRDGILGRCLVPQTWDMTLDEFPRCDEIPLRLPPIMSIVSVSYVDAAGVTQTMPSSDYELSADRAWRPRLRLAYNKHWPTTRHHPDSLTIRMECGYDSGNSPQDASGVPAAIKHAILLRVSDRYEIPDSVIVGTSITEVPMPLTCSALLAPYRLLHV